MKATTPASPALALRRRLSLAVMVMTAGLALPAQAQQAADWPSKPIRLIVTGPAGGTADILARLLAEGLQQDLKQPVIVESKAGASGALGIHELKASGKSGYTFLVIQDGALSEAPLAQKVSYDPVQVAVDLARQLVPVFLHHGVGFFPVAGFRQLQHFEVIAGHRLSLLNGFSRGVLRLTGLLGVPAGGCRRRATPVVQVTYRGAWAQRAQVREGAAKLRSPSDPGPYDFDS